MTSTSAPIPSYGGDPSESANSCSKQSSPGFNEGGPGSGDKGPTAEIDSERSVLATVQASRWGTMVFDQLAEAYGSVTQRRRKAIGNFLEHVDFLWPGAFEIGVGKFRCCDQFLATELRYCADDLRVYRQRVQKREDSATDQLPPFNILLAAPPGSGKSFLAKSLAAGALGLKPEKAKNYLTEFNLSWLRNSMHLFQLFSHVTSKAEDECKRDGIHFFVFDECDSEHEFPLYQNLLMPINDGYVYTSTAEGLPNFDQKTKLNPCVLIFVLSSVHAQGQPSVRMRLNRLVAATKVFFHGPGRRGLWEAVFRDLGFREVWTHEQNLKLYDYFGQRQWAIGERKRPKGPDFLSRVNHTIVLPSLTDEIGHQRIPGEVNARDLDRMILVSHFLRERFGEELQEIEKIVLYFFAVLRGERLSVRELKNIISKSRNSIDNKEVFRGEQLPPEYQRRFGELTRDFSIKVSKTIRVYNGLEDVVDHLRQALDSGERDLLGFEVLPRQSKLELIEKLGTGQPHLRDLAGECAAGSVVSIKRGDRQTCTNCFRIVDSREQVLKRRGDRFCPQCGYWLLRPEDIAEYWPTNGLSL